MGNLIVTDDTGERRQYPLNKERISIGRHSDNDITLNDKAISGHHAVIITILHDSYLEDLGSTNGTTVNGRSISKHSLSHGDQITIGRNTLVFESEFGAADFGKTLVPKPEHRPTPVPPAAAKLALGRLHVIDGPNQGKRLQLSKPLTTIGTPGLQVAAITRRLDGYYIVHVGSQANAGRPMINDTEIDGQAQRLSENDIIAVAGTRMRFELSA